MSIYSMTDTLKQKEINLYGSSRLGIYNVDIDVQNCNIVTPEITKFTRGNKFFELSNHLGNVLATISDKHVQVAAPGNTVVDYYTAELITATDYYPFGMQMPQRQFYIDTTTYIVGTTSTEAAAVIDTTVIELYKHSFSDTPSVHPYVTVPNVINANLSNSSWTNSRSMWTNYASNTNMGKAIAFDNSTSDTSTVTLTLNIASGKKVGIKSFSFYNRVSNSGYRHWKMYINGIEVGDSTLYYPATGGTGNNTVKSTGTVQVKNAVENLTGSITVLLKLYDHDAAYPNGNAQGTFRMDDFILNGYVNDDGGSAGSGYQYANKGGYRYGFNGKEQDPEVKGEGNQYDYGFRIYDPRIGRFLSVDPLTKSYPWYTPYQFAGNKPIACIDLDGLEELWITNNCFAPFDLFGTDFFGSYGGDGENRKFGDGGTFRTSGTAHINLNTAQKPSFTAGTSTSTYHRKLGSDYKVDSPSKIEETYYYSTKDRNYHNLQMHVSGPNKAAPPFVTPDIDNHVNIYFEKNPQDKSKVLVHGYVQGDHFPANETILSDKAGNKLVLGVAGPGADKNIGPYTLLWGDTKRDMYKFSMTILFNDDETFKGVELNGKQFNIAEWNKQFSKLNAQSTTVSTTTNNSNGTTEIKED